MVIRVSRQSSTVEATGRTLRQKRFSSWKRLTSLIGDAVNTGGALPGGALADDAVDGSSMTCNAMTIFCTAVHMYVVPVCSLGSNAIEAINSLQQMSFQFEQ